MKKTIAPEETYCQEEGCDGTLFNVTSRLEEALGRIVLKCDRCTKRWSMAVKLTSPNSVV